MQHCSVVMYLLAVTVLLICCINRGCYVNTQQFGQSCFETKTEGKIRGLEISCVNYNNKDYNFLVNNKESKRIGIIFIRESFPNITIQFEGQKVESCSSITNLAYDDLPKWASNLEALKKNISRYCFSTKESPIRGQSYHVIHKMSVENGGVFVAKKLAFVLPKEDGFHVLQKKSEVDKICSKICSTHTGGYGFGQYAFVKKSSNLTELLGKIAICAYCVYN